MVKSNQVKLRVVYSEVRCRSITIKIKSPECRNAKKIFILSKNVKLKNN